MRSFERVLAHLRFAFSRDHTVTHLSAFCVDAVELARAKDIEVTRHRRRGREAHFLAAGDFCFFFHRHVGNRGEILWHDGGELEPRAKARLVPAGKHSPRVRRFELRAEHDLLGAGALFLIRRVIKPLSLLIDLANKIQFQAVWAGW